MGFAHELKSSRRARRSFKRTGARAPTGGWSRRLRLECLETRQLLSGSAELLTDIQASPTSNAASLVAADGQATFRYDVASVLDVAAVWSGHPMRPSLLTAPPWQFVAFYDAERWMTVAARQLDSAEWQTVRLPSQLAWDSHNHLTMGVDDTGQLHVSGNMHNDPLVYFRTTRPYDITSLEQISTMVDGNAEAAFRYGPRAVDWLPVAGDWDGDGDTTVGLFDPVNSTFYLTNSNGPGVADEVFGYGSPGAGWLPLAGDWDGDGRSTVGLFDPASSTFYLTNSNRSGNAEIVFRYGTGGAGWVPVAGDWDADGDTTTGLFDPVNSTFYLSNTNSGAGADVVFRYGRKGAGWLPAAGDWDGDGQTTVGLFDPATATFFLENSHRPGSADEVFQYGSAGAGWLPVAGDWHGRGLALPGLFDQANSEFHLKDARTATFGSETSMTYPQFLHGPDGELLFTYRDGQSGSGDQVWNVYDSTTRTWRRLIDVPLLSGGGQMNAYLSGPVRGPDGMFHMAWVWRDTSDAATNHDLSYARSRDLVHWETSNGKPLELPITLARGEIVDPVPSGGGMLNNVKIGFDAQGRPIITYHKFDAAGNTQLYNARLEDGGWNIVQTSDWDYRWEFGGGGTIELEIRFEPVEVQPDGTLVQWFQHSQEESGQWRLDPVTLRPLGPPSPDRGFPPEFSQVQMDWPGLEVRLAKDSGSTGRPDLFYFLRWETLPDNRDQPRTGPLPPPSILRVYELILVTEDEDSWSPSIGSLSHDPDPVQRGNDLTLWANDVTDPDGDLASVTFWRDANDNQELDDSDQQLGTDSDPAGGWSVTVRAAAFPLGEATYFARATDSGGRVSSVVSATGVVQATLDLYGTDDANTIRFTTGAKHVVKIDDQLYVVDPTEFSVINIHGLGGDDTISIKGGAGDETAELHVGSVDMVGPAYEVHADSVEKIYVKAGASTRDQAYLYGSDTSRDVFIARAESARLYGDGFYHRVSGFLQVTATADAAGLLGAAGAGTDVAKLFDSAGSDAFEATPQYGKIKYDGSEDHLVQATGFRYVHAYAVAVDTPGSTDRAVLYDSPNDDILRVTPSYSNLYNKSEFFNRAVYFDEVVVQASERTWRDRVYFFDSPGHDHLHAVGDLAEFDYTALGRVLQAYGFTWVRATSSQGDDTKHEEAHDYILQLLPDAASWRDV